MATSHIKLLSTEEYNKIQTKKKNAEVDYNLQIFTTLSLLHGRIAITTDPEIKIRAYFKDVNKFDRKYIYINAKDEIEQLVYRRTDRKKYISGKMKKTDRNIIFGINTQTKEVIKETEKLFRDIIHDWKHKRHSFTEVKNPTFKL